MPLNNQDCQHILSQFPDAIIAVDVNGIIRYTNSQALHLFGFDEQDFLGSNLDIIIPEAFRERHWSGFNKAIMEKFTQYRGKAMTTKALNADGEFIYVELAFSIVLDDEGEVAFVLASARNIQERMEKEKELRQRLKKLETSAN